MDLKEIAKSVGATNFETLKKAELIDQIILLSANQKTEKVVEVKKEIDFNKLTQYERYQLSKYGEIKH